MAELWATEELPGHDWDPEPDDDPWCYHPDLWGQRAATHQLTAMTTIHPPRRYL